MLPRSGPLTPSLQPVAFITLKWRSSVKVEMGKCLVAAQWLGMCVWQLCWTLASFPEGCEVPWLLGAAGRHSMSRFCPPHEWMEIRWNVLEAETQAQLCPELLEMGTCKDFSNLEVSGAIWIKIGFLLAGKVWSLISGIMMPQKWSEAEGRNLELNFGLLQWCCCGEENWNTGESNKGAFLTRSGVLLLTWI